MKIFKARFSERSLWSLKAMRSRCSALGHSAQTMPSQQLPTGMFLMVSCESTTSRVLRWAPPAR